ncbi:MAG: hypothetical protein SGPRY_014739, partial [Prymnesium sp.]
MAALMAENETSAVDLLRREGVCCIADVLDGGTVEECLHASRRNSGEVLRHLMLTQLMRKGSLPHPPIRYAEVVERDGGRFDIRHGMNKPPFSSLFSQDGPACGLIRLLRRMLGEDAVVVAMGQVLAMSEEGWVQSTEGAGGDDVSMGLGDQQWHTDGPIDLFEDSPVHIHSPPYALNVFFPLVDLNESNGPTEFAPGAPFDQIDRQATRSAFELLCVP